VVTSAVKSTLDAVRPAAGSSTPFPPQPVFNHLQTLFSSAALFSNLTPLFSGTSAHFPVAAKNREFLSFVFLHLRTLYKLAFRHLSSFQLLPHSLRKNRWYPSAVSAILFLRIQSPAVVRLPSRFGTARPASPSARTSLSLIEVIG